MKIKLNKTFLENVKPSETQDLLVWDEVVPSLFVRVRSSGRKSFYAYYRLRNRKQQKLKLGDFPFMTVDEAREKCRSLNYRAFDGFDPKVVAEYDDVKLEELMQDAGIIRNRQKLKAAISNARAFLKVQEEFGSFDRYIWGFTDGKVIDHHLLDGKDMPAKDELSEKISADLKERGFKYVGATTIYSYLQGIGIINDHWEYCEYR